MSEIISQWKNLDEATLRARRRRVCLRRVVFALAAAASVCLFISVLLGVLQSFLGQWWMKPPRYPNAVQFTYEEGWMLHEGEVCQMGSPGVYCYEWYYRTDDSVEEVVAYYKDLEWRLHSPIKFEWRRGRRFAGPNWVAEDNIMIFSNICGYQIIVHPSPDGDTEIYILERGAMGDYR
ncbi:MAG: hypothetical protein SWK90_16005 [Chloroflexota bacterium]|nr:hypothetical protein [Chloroflexota bacterium]